MTQSSTAEKVIAVTGGAGFIGSHTVDQLVAAGRRVVVVDDFSTGKRANLSQWDGDARVAVVEGDVSAGLDAPLAGRGVDGIVHLAAQTAVTHSIEHPLDDVRVNYAGTVQVLEYARRNGVRKVVFSSSAAVYGDVDALPVREDAECRPVSPYGIDKLGSEKFLYYYSVVHGIASTALRFFNVYGPRQDPSSPYSGVISIFADRAFAGEPLTIFGDGEQTRDFIYVGDIARTIVTALCGDAGDRAVANLGTGIETSVNALAATIVEIAGTGAPIEHADARAGEILRSVADVSRARDLFGGGSDIATVSLTDGLRETLAWVRGA
jgi:UDP-glucose 4-epimerase